MIAQLLIAHLAGDFLFQNHWMQRKAQSSFVCSVHVATYAVPFVLLASFGALAWWQLALIVVEHWLQDRYALHVKWMRTIKQTTPEQWPMGPLFVDQAMHAVWMGLVVWLGSIL
jgi:hypothetical protein